MIARIILIYLCFFINGHAAVKVAKVTFVRGEVSVLFPGSNNARQLKRGEVLVEDTSILTGKKGILKIEYLSGGKTTVAPNSKIILTRGGSKKATLMSLLKGQIRSKIPPKKQGQKEKGLKHQVIIKSRFSSLGVRGTDFLVTHNPENNVTGLITFEGEVSFAKLKRSHLVEKLERRILGPKSIEDIDYILESEEAYVVREGRYSGITPSKDLPSVPVKISPKQFSLLKKNVDLDFSSTQQITNVKGIKLKDFYDDPPPEGFFDKKTGAYAPKSGGYLDIQTGVYIQPEKNAKFDAGNKVFELGEDLGGVNSGGDYVPPKGLELNSKKGFYVKKMSTKDKVNLALNLFKIDKKEEISVQTEKNLERSLRQILGVKKAILNNEIADEYLADDLESYKKKDMAEEFRKALDSIKEVLEFDAEVKLTHTSNAHQKLMNQTIKVTNSAAQVLSTGAVLGHHNYLLGNWLTTPFVGINLDYFISSNEKAKNISSLKVEMGIKNKIDHKFGKLDVDVLLERNTHLSSQDLNFESSYNKKSTKRVEDGNYFYQIAEVKVRENIPVTKLDGLYFGGGYGSLDTFSSVINGTYRFLELGALVRFFPRYRLDLSYETRKRDSRNDLGDVSSKTYNVKLSVFDVLKFYTFELGYSKINWSYDNSTLLNLKGDEKEKNIRTSVFYNNSNRYYYGIVATISSKKSKSSESHYDEKNISAVVKYKF